MSNDMFTIGFPMSGMNLVADDHVERNGAQVRIGALAMHTAVTGGSGSGKSVLIKRFMESVTNAGVSVFAVDVLGDLAAVAEPLTPTQRFKEIVAERGLPMPTNIDGLPTTVWTLDSQGAQMRMPLGELAPTMVGGLLGAYTGPMQVCIDAIIRYRGHTIETIDDMIRELRRAAINGVESVSPGQKTCDVLIARCESLRDRLGDFFGPRSFDFERDIVDSGRVNVLDARQFADVDMRTALAGMTGTFLEMCKALPPSPELRMLFVIDEASFYFKAESTQRRAAIRMMMDSYADAFRTLRKKGVGILVASQSPGDIPEFALDNCATVAQMRVPGSKITPKTVRSLVGSDLDASTVERVLRNITSGQGIIRTEDGSFAIDVLAPGCSIGEEPDNMNKLLADSHLWWKDNSHMSDTTVERIVRRAIG